MIDDSTFTVCTVEGKHSDSESLRDPSRRDLPPPPGRALYHGFRLTVLGNETRGGGWLRTGREASRRSSLEDLRKSLRALLCACFVYIMFIGSSILELNGREAVVPITMMSGLRLDVLVYGRRWQWQLEWKL